LKELQEGAELTESLGMTKIIELKEDSGVVVAIAIDPQEVHEEVIG
jgi:hypothetical protein